MPLIAPKSIDGPPTVSAVARITAHCSLSLTTVGIRCEQAYHPDWLSNPCVTSLGAGGLEGLRKLGLALALELRFGPEFGLRLGLVRVRVAVRVNTRPRRHLGTNADATTLYTSVVDANTTILYLSAVDTD